MSRFAIDKFMAYIEGLDAEVRRYVSDPVAYVAEWERRAESSRLPTPDSGTLTDEERGALVSMDHAALYRMGGHPYLLWHFVEAINVWGGDMTWPEMVALYRDDIRPHGTPWYGT